MAITFPVTKTVTFPAHLEVAGAPVLPTFFLLVDENLDFMTDENDDLLLER